MNVDFDAVYYEPRALEYPLGQELAQRFKALPWIEIESHNRIPELSTKENREFQRLKRHLIIGVRKTHNYTENSKVSDFLVPYTSSGCRAMCLYCYLVCHYEKNTPKQVPKVARIWGLVFECLIRLSAIQCVFME